MHFESMTDLTKQRGSCKVPVSGTLPNIKEEEENKEEVVVRLREIQTR